MPLESLSSEQFNIHDLTLEQEKRPIPEWQKHYEDLKGSSLFDHENNMWNNFLEPVRDFQKNKPIGPQLLGITIESFFEKEKANTQLNRLKETQLFDPEKEEWNLGLDSKGKLDGNNRMTFTQLLGIFAELNIDREVAIARFEKLKEPGSKYYNQENETWNASRHENFGGEITRSANDELLAIIVEANSDLDLAKKHWENLKDTPLYDKKTGDWYPHLRQGLRKTVRGLQTDNQLLGILVESVFDKPAAKERFENMKNPKYFDQEKGLWCDRNLERYSPQQEEVYYRSFDQLLGILCEQAFEEKMPDLNQSSISPPETRSY